MHQLHFVSHHILTCKFHWNVSLTKIVLVIKSTLFLFKLFKNVYINPIWSWLKIVPQQPSKFKNRIKKKNKFPVNNSSKHLYRLSKWWPNNKQKEKHFCLWWSHWFRCSSFDVTTGASLSIAALRVSLAAVDEHRCCHSDKTSASALV